MGPIQGSRADPESLLQAGLETSDECESTVVVPSLSRMDRLFTAACGDPTQGGPSNSFIMRLDLAFRTSVGREHCDVA